MLTKHLDSLVARIHAGAYSDRRLDDDLVREFHFNVFTTVRLHAGKIRRPGEGAEHLRFGPNRSASREEVPTRLAKVMEDGRKSFASFARDPDDPEYDRKAIHLAVWVHAQIIRVHPFEDGNGRVSRLVLSHLLVALGLRPIPLEATRTEYNECLNAYFKDEAKFSDLVDLFLRCYPRPPAEVDGRDS